MFSFTAKLTGIYIFPVLRLLYTLHIIILSGYIAVLGSLPLWRLELLISYGQCLIYYGKFQIKTIPEVPFPFMDSG